LGQTNHLEILALNGSEKLGVDALSLTTGVDANTSDTIRLGLRNPGQEKLPICLITWRGELALGRKRRKKKEERCLRKREALQ
jgi:hypothetical protein